MRLVWYVFVCSRPRRIVILYVSLKNRCSCCPRWLQCQSLQHGCIVTSQIISSTPMCALFSRFIIPRTHYGRRHNSVLSPDRTQRRRHPESHGNLAINTHNQLEVAVHTTYDQYLGSPEDKDIPLSGWKDGCATNRSE